MELTEGRGKDGRVSSAGLGAGPEVEIEYEAKLQCLLLYQF